MSLGGENPIRYKSNMTTLLEVPINENVYLSTIPGGKLRVKLSQVGLYPGDCIRVVRVAPLGGPLLVEVHGREIALGRGVAAKILVEAECELR